MIIQILTNIKCVSEASRSAKANEDFSTQTTILKEIPQGRSFVATEAIKNSFQIL